MILQNPVALSTFQRNMYLQVTTKTWPQHFMHPVSTPRLSSALSACSRIVPWPNPFHSDRV